MNTRSSAATVLSLATAVVAVAVLSRPPAPALRTAAGPILPRAAFLHAAFAAQQNLVADYFWILTTHQIGAAQLPDEFRDVYAYADLATDLDPWFRTVYWFAGVAIPVQTERDRYANADESTKILRKGAARFPSDFRIKFQLAQNLIYLHKQYREAADLLKELTKFPGAPGWLGSFATRLYAQSGEYETSVQLTKELIATAQDEETRQFYERRLKEIRQEGILKRIDTQIAAFKKDKGRLPTDMSELVHAGYVPGLPADPLGGAYFIDPDGRARSSASKYRLGVITMEEHVKIEHATEGADDGGHPGH